MKRMNGKRGVLRAAALGQVLLLVVAGCKSPGEKVVSEEAVRLALAGKDGNVQINTANTVVNGYSALTGTPNANQVTVNDIADFGAGGRPALAVGDLVLIIQMQGATIGTPNDATYGNVSNYNNAGNYEFAGVAAIAGNTITLGCNRQNAYTAAGNAQVIRVPQYDTLTITGAGSVTAQTWNGTVGGVVAVQAATTLQLNGSIDVSGKGFRGGAADNASAAIATDIATYRSGANTDGAEKGESIAGPAVNLANGRYGRGAPANGGGGGDSHNGGGGGGANVSASGTWTGQGVMSAVTGGTGVTSAWRLDPGYTANGGAPTTSSGGGRGGYTFSGNQQNPTANGEGPGVANWGGNSRREHGGLGGHPLTSSPGGRLFLGGGGGAGDGNDGHAGPGGQGGGLVFVIAGTVQGAGSIVANGAVGGTATSGNGASGDAAGGGGGGGTVIVRAAALSQISVVANGGLGGNQQVNNVYEAEGPGGGGGGGYVAFAGGAPASVLASGVLGGTTNSAGVAQFPSNGATSGHDGVTDGVASTFLYCSSPNTVIATFPSNPTGVAVGSFTFTSPQSAVTFECSLDGVAAYAACDADYTTPALTNAAHTIDVRAKDINGNVDATPAHYAWTVNAAGLDTAIASAPATLTNAAVATFVFTSNPTTGVTFQCLLDGATTWTTCAATYTTPALGNGAHTLSVRARDSGGNVDTTPATYDWVADLIAPNTTIVTSPLNPTNSPTGDFTFSGTDTGGGAVTFECRIDGAAFSTCPASFTAGPLDDGTHTLDVRARDLAGNVDVTPATYTWEVHLLGLDAAIPDSAAPDTAVIDTAPIIPDSAVPDTRPDTAAPDLPLPDARLDSPAVDLVPVDAPPVGTPDARPDASDADADGGVVDALADVLGRDVGTPDTQVVVVVDSRPIDTIPALVPDAQIVVPPTPDAAVQPNPEEVIPAIPNPRVMGSGFCSVNSMPGSAPGLFTFFLVAAFGLLVFRRRR
jgi:hypothetical protein